MISHVRLAFKLCSDAKRRSRAALVRLGVGSLPELPPGPRVVFLERSGNANVVTKKSSAESTRYAA